jgi:hypothetical protein
MAVSAGERRSSQGGAGGLQVSLGGLIVLVLAAGVAAGVGRSAREVWGTRAPSSLTILSGPRGATTAVPVARTAGFVVEIAAVFLVVSLAFSFFGQLRGGQADEIASRPSRLWGAIWRIGATCYLLWFISEESLVLRFDLAQVAARSQMERGWDAQYRLKEQLVPVCGVFALLGIAIGMGGRFLFPLAPRAGYRPYWAFVILAGVAAVLVVSLPYWASLITYLILVALEAVSLAMMHAATPGPGLSARLLRAGIDASVSAALCLALALVLARDFDRLRRGQPWHDSRFARGLRLVCILGAAAAGLYIATVTMPAIHRWLSRGFRDVIDRTDVVMILCCFGFLGAGMAARALAGPPAGEIPPWLRRLAASARVTLLAVILFAALNSLPDPLVLEAHAPPFFTWIVAFIKAALGMFWGRLPEAFSATILECLAVENLAWTTLLLALICFAIELIIRAKSPAAAPFDQLASSPQAAGRFIWLVVGFIVLCVAAMPTLLVAGQAVLHVHTHAADLAKYGWPR